MGPLRTPVGKLNCIVLHPAQRAHLKPSPACTSPDGRPHPESGGRAERTSLPVTRSLHPGACFQQVSVSLFLCSLLLAAGTVALLASRGCVSQRSSGIPVLVSGVHPENSASSRCARIRMRNPGQGATGPPGMPGRVLMLSVGTDDKECFSGLFQRTDAISSQASVWWSVVRVA